MTFLTVYISEEIHECQQNLIKNSKRKAITVNTFY